MISEGDGAWPSRSSSRPSARAGQHPSRMTLCFVEQQLQSALHEGPGKAKRPKKTCLWPCWSRWRRCSARSADCSGHDGAWTLQPDGLMARLMAELAAQDAIRTASLGALAAKPPDQPGVVRCSSCATTPAHGLQGSLMTPGPPPGPSTQAPPFRSDACTPAHRPNVSARIHADDPRPSRHLACRTGTAPTGSATLTHGPPGSDPGPFGRWPLPAKLMMMGRGPPGQGFPVALCFPTVATCGDSFETTVRFSLSPLEGLA